MRLLTGHKAGKYFSVELGEKYLLERRGIDVLADESTLGLPRWRIRPYKRAIYLFGTIVPGEVAE